MSTLVSSFLMLLIVSSGADEESGLHDQLHADLTIFAYGYLRSRNRINGDQLLENLINKAYND